jgi:class 3 adenylate cyclase/DNA-binding transcriptional MerR regulator
VLSSKEVLERTGISRATLNNYIGSGLVPRPEVLPPNPEHGAAPRIGYFPDDTVERIGQIQRLKQQGWSIARIAAHLAGGAALEAPAPAPQAPVAQRAAEPAPADRLIAPPAIQPPPPPAPAPALPAAGHARVPAPILTPVSVLVSTLQDAGELWLQLPAGEYFELVNEVWLELDRIFRRHGGRHGKHPGEGMVCHFLPQPSASYLWSALAAAHQAREAMRQISSRWQARKGWDFELCMNTGVDEGQEWLGALRLAEPLELTVVGGAADHAAQLSRSVRDGAVWITRNLVGKLSAEERRGLTFGVPRADRRVLSSFARLADLAATNGSPAVPAALADLPITELLDLDTVPPSPPSPARPLA